MQLMCKHSEENDTNCLGIFDEKVKLFPQKGLKVPQIGWNNISSLKSGLFEGVSDGIYMYFVHSYFVEECDNAIAKTDYVIPYSSAIQKNNFSAVQFHPEKSGEVGQKILENFIKGY